MRKATIPDQCLWFEQKVDELEAMVGGLIDSAVSLGAKRWVAKMGAVEAWSLFSQFAESVLYCSINRSSARLRETTGLLRLPEHINMDTINALFTLDRGYFDFGSYGQLIDMSRRYVSESEDDIPFKKPDPNDRRLADGLAKIRNRIIHESRKSRKSYEALMRDQFEYDRVPSPEVFLLSQTNGKSRLGELLDALRRISIAIRS